MQFRVETLDGVWVKGLFLVVTSTVRQEVMWPAAKRWRCVFQRLKKKSVTSLPLSETHFKYNSTFTADGDMELIMIVDNSLFSIIQRFENNIDKKK